MNIWQLLCLGTLLWTFNFENSLQKARRAARTVHSSTLCKRMYVIDNSLFVSGLILFIPTMSPQTR